MNTTQVDVGAVRGHETIFRTWGFVEERCSIYPDPVGSRVRQIKAYCRLTGRPDPFPGVEVPSGCGLKYTQSEVRELASRCDLWLRDLLREID